VEPAIPSTSEAQLVDCGEGRRLDRLGARLVDRPAPAAEVITRARPELWSNAVARFERRPGAPGAWLGTDVPREPWTVAMEQLRFELRLTGTGQVGLFLEQVPMWRWIRARVSEAGRPLEVLNLFAHTGGSTLAAASAGASVVHVDGSRSVVAWARRNAELSNLSAAPVRWIVDDVQAFIRRELRRGHGYDAVILDPPSFGHGPKREQWRLEEQLPDLLASVGALTRGRRSFVLLTTHTPGFDGDRLAQELDKAIPIEERQLGSIDSGDLELLAESGARLHSGSHARWIARP